MDADKRTALEAAGWRFGDAADFLGLADDERQLLDARIEAALAVRRLREAQKLSQKQLASRIKTSQPRVAKIERAAADVSLDQILRAFTAVGGRIRIKQLGRLQATPDAGQTAKIRRKRTKTGVKPQVAGVQIELIGAEL